MESDTTTTFADLGVNHTLQRICREMGMKIPTPVQRHCIEPILNGRDVIASSETGSGKTAAFALPIIQILSKDVYGVFALVLTPTRELAFQIADQFKAFGSDISIRVSVIVGGMDMLKQSRELQTRPHVVVATPGRLMDLLKSTDSFHAIFRRVRFLVLDEADRLLEPGFSSDLGDILDHLPPSKGESSSEGELSRQTLLFSATITPSITELQEESPDSPFVWQYTESATTVENLVEEYLFIPSELRMAYLTYLVSSNDAKTVIIFVPTCWDCQLIHTILGEIGIQTTPLHSKTSQNNRLASLARFKSGIVSVLIATDVASRGLDIPTVDMVINYDVPTDPKNYIHRVGRCARAGRSGNSITLVSQYDVSLIGPIEAQTGKKMKEYEHNEEKVLSILDKVNIARRVSIMKLEENGFKDNCERKKKRRRKEVSEKGKK